MVPRRWFGSLPCAAAFALSIGCGGPEPTTHRGDAANPGPDVRDASASADATSTGSDAARSGADAATPDDSSVAPHDNNPFAGARFYVLPGSDARRQADAWRTSRPADATAMDKIANQPWAAWFGDWSGDVAAAVDRYVTTARGAGALAVMVAYNIPHRDCGNYSAGGAASPEAYRTWIQGFAQGIHGRRAVVILEPDGLPLITCLSDADQQSRYDLIAGAVDTLSAGGTTAVYIDAATWVGAADMAARLNRANVAHARGFSVNVSNFETTADVIAYGHGLASQIGGKPFLIDTSRNGLGPTADHQWCNPPGRALGNRATAQTGDALVDAFFWIKTPGESDGTCNGGPSAGTFWPDYALGLAQRAAY